MITIIPAIDLKDGHCVRLRQGKPDDCTIYIDDPLEAAARWQEEGAQYIHVVDLDGAFSGKPVHGDIIARIAQNVNIPIEIGGGMRTDDDIRAMLDRGVNRVIIGTRALAEPAVLGKLVEEFGPSLAVGIDARNGLVQVKGWRETSSVKAVELAGSMDALNVHTIIYTDTATDGMMQGPNVDAMEKICSNVKCNVIASGGITKPADVEALAALHKDNLNAAIVGKALYEGKVTLQELSEVGQ